MENKNIRQQSSPKDEVINLTDLIKIFTRNWKWFVLSVFFFLGIGALYILIKNPVYIVNGLVLLREDEKKTSSPMSMISGLSDLGSMMGSKNIDNEVVIFNTRRIMKQSILDLGYQASMTINKGLKTINPYPDYPFLLKVDSLQLDTMKTITFKISPQKDGSYKVKGKYHKTKFDSTISHFPATIKTPGNVDVYIERNPLVIEEKPQKVEFTIYNPNRLAIELNKDIFAGATSKKTTIIRLSTETDNVKWAQDLLNQIITNFNRDAIEDKNLTASLTSSFVDERLGLIKKELDEIELTGEKYKQENGLTDISSEAKLFLEQMSESEKIRIETQIQLNMIEYIAEYVQNPKYKNNLIPSIGIEDKGLLAVIVSYNEMLAEKNRLESASTEANPALQLLNAQLVSVRQNILGNIGNISQSMEIILKDLKRQDQIANNRIKNIPRQEREYIDIVRQQEIKSKLYSFLLQKKEETSLNLASMTPKARIIDEPMPGILPIAPKKMTIGVIFLFLGIAIPFAFFYLRKILKTEIETKEELESLSSVEVIGEICRNNKQERVVVKPHETSPSVELFRLLRTNLSFLQKTPQEKIIMLTSTISGEGKTFVSINLALSFALIEKKILVVGLDIRNPRLGDYLKIPSGKGVTNYLIDTDLSVADIVQQSDLHPNLDIIQAGPIPPNPNELLMNHRMNEFFSEIRDLYDYIILDTAPVGLVSDTFLLNKFADINLYVVRIGVAKKESVRYMNSIKESKKLKNLYAVANDIDLKEKNGGYGYGYGHNVSKT